MIWKYHKGCDLVTEHRAYVLHAFASLGPDIGLLNNVKLILCFAIQNSLAEHEEAEVWMNFVSSLCHKAVLYWATWKLPWLIWKDITFALYLAFEAVIV